MKSYALYRLVPLSVTLSNPEPQFQGHSIVERRISRKRCIRSTPCLVLLLGYGFLGSADRMALIPVR